MKYDAKHIDTLLERYWQGNTSLSQEAELRQYFSREDVSGKHLPYKELFQHFSTQRALTTDLDVDKVLTSISKPRPTIFKLFAVKRYTMGIAAALTLMLSVVTVMNIQSNTHGAGTIVLDDASETEEAMRITKQALALLGSTIDNSSREVNNGVKKMKSASILR